MIRFRFRLYLAIGLVIAVLIGIVVDRLFGTLIEQKAERRIAEIGLTSNEFAANGPIPGEVSLYADELACQQRLPTPGYYSSLNGAELADAQRSGLYPCATFAGSFDGPNQVYAWLSADTYQGVSYINDRKPGELYIVGGEYPTPQDPVPAGPYVAKADATTGRQIWRTYVDNPNVSGRWIGNANLNILPNGNIAFAWSNQIVLLDGDTGQILKRGTLPAGEAPIADVNFKHLTIAPDGTLILKDQTRPLGCTLQGTVAILKCTGKQPNSQLVAVDPSTLQVLDDIPLPEPSDVPHAITMFDGKIAIYIGMNRSARRAFWDPGTKKLALDQSWAIYPMQEGQTTATAPTLIGDWIGFQLNGAGSDTVSSSIVVASQSDPKKIHIVFPFGPLKPGEWSFCPPKAGADPENSMIYSADVGLQKVAGIKLDQATGELKVAFVLDTTNTFQPLIGPKDKRVLLLTNIKKNVDVEPIKDALFTGNYTEQLTWRDAATGRIIAASDFFSPLSINSLNTPGFGGRAYFQTAIGKRFIVLEVLPKRASQ